MLMNPRPLTNYAPQHPDDTPSVPSFSLPQVYLTNTITKPMNSSLYKVQSNSDSTKPRLCYATHKNDMGKCSNPFRFILKPNAQLMTQRPSKFQYTIGTKLMHFSKN